MKTTRPPPAVRFGRRLGKLGYFVFRANGPTRSWWLAAHDAVLHHDYAAVSLVDLQAAWDATGTWKEISVVDGKLVFSSLGVTVRGRDLVAQEHGALQLARARGFILSRAGAHVKVEDDSLALRLTTAEEISMLREIFLERCYEAHLRGEWIVLDVGANVGLASLFFAARTYVRRVIAFEPFGPTADLHAGNVAANPALAAKIELHRHGLGAENQRLAVRYDPDLRGSMTVGGLGEWRGLSSRPTQEVHIEIRSASEIWHELKEEFRGARVMAKLDCEGSEFAILDKWETCGALARIDLFVIEWHQKEPAELLERLARAGFGAHTRPLVPQGTLGLIWAWRDR